MRYKLYVFAPDQNDVIDAVIHAAAEAGAGAIGNYTHCAFILKGEGNWRSGEEARPAVGEPGAMSREPEARIEMECPEERLHDVLAAIKSAHPYEEAVVDVVQLEKIRG